MKGLIYNVTAKVDWSIREAWLQWMLDTHVPEVLGTGCFERHQITRLLETDDRDGPVYAVQYYAGSYSQYQQYIELYSTRLRKAAIDKWGDKFIAFSSLMEIVQ